MKEIKYLGFTIIDYGSLGTVIVKEFQYENIFGDVDDAKNAIDEVLLDFENDLLEGKI